MAKKFNPFHRWLGFDKSVTKPSHFELFGVKPHSDDPIGFKKKIHSQAKKLLKMLEAMSAEQIGDRGKLHTKMRRHIVRAHEILLDDDLRAAYKKELRAKVRETKGNALATPPPKVPPVVASKQKIAVNKKTPGSTLPQEARRPKPAKIPMAQPVSAVANGGVSEDKRNSAAHDAGEISVKVAVPKPKRSWAIFIACAVMVLFCVAGIAALWMRFGNKFEAQSNFQTPATQTEQLDK